MAAGYNWSGLTGDAGLAGIGLRCGEGVALEPHSGWGAPHLKSAGGNHGKSGGGRHFPVSYAA